MDCGKSGPSLIPEVRALRQSPMCPAGILPSQESGRAHDEAHT
jgi:hypothetical protein